MSFEPIESIRHSFSAFHLASDDRGKAIHSIHLCSCPSDQFFQCLIYSDDGKLIGIEYMVDEATFQQFSNQEKKLWHSHKYEVESGILVCTGWRGVVGKVAGLAKMAEDLYQAPTGSGGAVPDELEQYLVAKIYRMYGKIIHTWHPPQQEFPLGPPVLMMSATQAHPGPSAEDIHQRDTKFGINTEEKKKARQGLFGHDFVIDPAADQMKEGEEGKAYQFTVAKVDRKV